MMKIRNIKIKRHIFMIVIVFVLLTIAGYSVIAQGSDNDNSERIENSLNQYIPLSDETKATMIPVYHFAGVLNSSTEGTAIQCTNLDETNSTIIEVQLYQYNATIVDTGTIIVAPLRTVTFESTPIDFYIADVAMNADPIEQGYGRILAEHGNIVCTVQILDAINNPPTWFLNIPIYTKSGCGSYVPLILK